MLEHERRSDFWKVRIDNWTELDKTDRMSEILFGLIMVLSFTGTISASTAGEQDVRQLLWAALGCNIAWGLVDGIMYLMDELIARAYNAKQISKIRMSGDVNESRKIIRGAIPPLVSECMDDGEIDSLGEKLKKLPELPAGRFLTLKNFLIAFQIFLLVFLVTFPVTLPFLFIGDVALALRISNGVAVALLFAAGYSLAKHSGLKPVRTALVYTAIGMFLVSLTMALGG